MSKRVKSDGRVQKALLAAIDDLSLEAMTIAKYLSRKNLTCCTLKAITYIKTRWYERFSGSNPIVYDAGVLNLFDEFIKIRKKQSKNYRDTEKVDYSILSSDQPGKKEESLIEKWDSVLSKMRTYDQIFKDNPTRDKFIATFMENIMRCYDDFRKSKKIDVAIGCIVTNCFCAALRGELIELPQKKSGDKK